MGAGVVIARGPIGRSGRAWVVTVAGHVTLPSCAVLEVLKASGPYASWWRLRDWNVCRVRYRMV